MTDHPIRRLLAHLRRPADPWTVPYDGIATAADVAACFRLLLGRPPNREEWRGHAAQAGQPLPGVVASYVRSLEFSRRGLLDADGLGAIELADLPGFRIHTAADDAAVGRHVRADDYERDVTAVFRRLLSPGMGVLDVGANIGYFTMLSASLVGPAGHVFAVEPNPRNARLIEASRRANGFAQVTLCQAAAGPATGILALHTAHSNGTTSAPADDLAALLAAETVACLRLDDIVPAERPLHLVKVDVEGAEYAALRGATALLARHRPAIITEFSPDLMPGISGISGPDYLTWLFAQGYEVAVVQPDGSTTAPGTRTEPVLETYRARGTDHLDLLATPVAA